MKKTYQNPITEIYLLEAEAQILAGSGQADVVSGTGQEGAGDDTPTPIIGFSSEEQDPDEEFSRGANIGLWD